MENRKIDLKKHASEKASTWYLIKLIFYIICIIVLTIIMYFQYQKLMSTPNTETEEIKGVTVELPDQSNL